jgi:hypothetical protein
MSTCSGVVSALIGEREDLPADADGLRQIVNGQLERRMLPDWLRQCSSVSTPFSFRNVLNSSRRVVLTT